MMSRFFARKNKTEKKNSKIEEGEDRRTVKRK
jgi:hypothetical protein